MLQQNDITFHMCSVLHFTTFNTTLLCRITSRVGCEVLTTAVLKSSKFNAGRVRNFSWRHVVGCVTEEEEEVEKREDNWNWKIESKDY
jgi:hypothetical protein